MKRGIVATLLALTVIGGLLLSACGAEATATPPAENAVDLLYTAAANASYQQPACSRRHRHSQPACHPHALADAKYHPAAGNQHTILHLQCLLQRRL